MSETTTNPSDDSLLTKQDVAAIYRIHPRTVLDWDGKRIPKRVDYWPGKDARWLKSEIMAHIASMRKRAQREQVA